ncbi:UNVERIFIED_CONTAM: hypothetical protein NCL1_21952 [Trichonephila clavipes]
MAFALQNSTIEEQRNVIRFLTAEGEKPAAIHRRMVTVYGEKCVSDKSVRKWSARFRAGRESVGDNQRPGQANTVITSDLLDKVDDLSNDGQTMILPDRANLKILFNSKQYFNLKKTEARNADFFK